MCEYLLVVDYGKPYEEKIHSDKLMDELKKLEAICEESSYCDIFIFDDRNIDVTDEIFREYRRRI